MKKIIISAILSLAAMVLVPVIAVSTALSPDALGLMFIFTFLLNPVVSIVIGILSGWDNTVMWYLPLGNAAVYFIAAAVLMGFDVSLLIGAVVYFALGIAAAFVTGALRKRKAGK